MNFRIVAKIISIALKMEAALMALPLLSALIFGESVKPFLLTAAVCFVAALFLDSQREVLMPGIREGLAATGLTWIAISLGGMLPFLFSGSISSVMDAFFETVSGFTTTGASILTDIEALPKSVLLWRSFTHWLGGMGILVFMMAFLPNSAGAQMNLMKAESPGPSISKLVPRSRDTARILYLIYAILTAGTFLLLVLFRMPVFDALCITFGCAGTGGFGVLNSSCASYTTAQQIIITVSMLSFGMNFNFYFLIGIRRFSEALSMEEIRYYLMVVAAAVVLMTSDLIRHGLYGPGRALLETCFHTGSLMTTTGFGIADLNAWPSLSRAVCIFLSLLGACAGSTGGGFKVGRAILLVKSYIREISIMMRPGTVKHVHVDGKAVDENVVQTAEVYFFVYCMIMGISVVLVALNGFDWTSTVTSVIATFNNIGPGFGMVGTAGNYSAFSTFSKLVLSADMLIGRLEIFPILLLFARSTWRKF